MLAVVMLCAGDTEQAQAALSLSAASADVLHQARQAGDRLHEAADFHVPRRADRG